MQRGNLIIAYKLDPTFYRGENGRIDFILESIFAVTICNNRENVDLITTH